MAMVVTMVATEEGTMAVVATVVMVEEVMVVTEVEAMAVMEVEAMAVTGEVATVVTEVEATVARVAATTGGTDTTVVTMDTDTAYCKTDPPHADPRKGQSKPTHSCEINKPLLMQECDIKHV